MGSNCSGVAFALGLTLALLQGCGGGGGETSTGSGNASGVGGGGGGGAVYAVTGLTPGTSWNWQIDGGTIDQTVLDGVSNSKKMYDVDMENTDVATISQLKAKGIYVVCYIEVGSYNRVRTDAFKFAAVPGLIGKPVAGYPNESWIDVRRTDALMPIMNARLDQAQSKGCQGIEPDLDDSYTQDSGFSLTQSDSVAYLSQLVQAAHARSMSMGLKNGPTMAAAMAPLADWALNEECNQFAECDVYKAFIVLNKAVFQVEFMLNGTTTLQFCPADNTANFDGLLKQSSQTLGALPRTACRFG